MQIMNNLFKVAKISLVVVGLLTTSCTCRTKDNGTYSHDKYSEGNRAVNSQLQQYNNATVHFGFDKSSLDTKARSILNDISKVVADNSSATYTVEGHCDERGTEDYNIALGERRANSAKKYIEERNSGNSNISVISYGKSQPIATGHTEADYAMNRRATVKAN